MKRSCKTYIESKEKEPVLLAKLRSSKAGKYFDIFFILVLVWYVLAVPLFLRIRLLRLLAKQLEALEKKFLEAGEFRENLFKLRKNNR
jgi:hypothetical protein